MEIKKIMRKDGVTVVVYEDNGSTFTIKTAEDPRSSLLAAMLKLKQPLLRNLGLPLRDSVDKDYKDSAHENIRKSVATSERSMVSDMFTVCGLVHSISEKNGESFRILGIFADNTLKTSGMTVSPQGDKFWDGNDAVDYPDFLTPEDIDNIRKLLAEADAFVCGAREQPELFKEEQEDEE